VEHTFSDASDDDINKILGNMRVLIKLFLRKYVD